MADYLKEGMQLYSWDDCESEKQATIIVEYFYKGQKGILEYDEKGNFIREWREET